MYPYNITSDYKKNININSIEGEKAKNTNTFQDKRLLQLIELIICETKSLSEYFNNIYKNISDTKNKELIKSIYLDIVKSRKYIEDIYFRASNERVNYKNDDNKKVIGNFVKDIENSIMYLYDYSRDIRSLYVLFDDCEIKDLIMEILSDIHGDMAILNFIYIKISNNK